MTTTQTVSIQRTFDAPIDLVWQMWTDPEHFAAWYGPVGASIPVARMDVRVGGTRHVSMQMTTPNGDMQMWFVGEYLAVEPPHRLVYTESMSDADGNVVPPTALGLPADHPEVTEVTVVLEDLGGRTHIVLTHAGIAADSPGEMGWIMALDKLEQRLTSL